MPDPLPNLPSFFFPDIHSRQHDRRNSSSSKSRGAPKCFRFFRIQKTEVMLIDDRNIAEIHAMRFFSEGLWTGTGRPNEISRKRRGVPRDGLHEAAGNSKLPRHGFWDFMEAFQAYGGETNDQIMTSMTIEAFLRLCSAMVPILLERRPCYDSDIKRLADLTILLTLVQFYDIPQRE
ncbi:hypothetical protein CDAR_404491 [Caerostris darwini]|uniref:Uncharacterized protein n=1 Tax=Caerostris darwini TaxID=1538125 RepID=A0AAV4SSA0_9ARAC|nr:hypothetical protein CDAR_404491 [Caerostris darwini]